MLVDLRENKMLFLTSKPHRSVGNILMKNNLSLCYRGISLIQFLSVQRIEVNPELAHNLAMPEK